MTMYIDMNKIDKWVWLWTWNWIKRINEYLNLNILAVSYNILLDLILSFICSLISVFNKCQSGTNTQGSADAKAFVYADPNIAYEAQYTGTPTQADIGKVHTISTTAGDSNMNRSKEGVTTTTASGIAKQVGFVERPDNSIGEFARGYFTFPASTFGND